jgi:hypothetical protein
MSNSNLYGIAKDEPVGQDASGLRPFHPKDVSTVPGCIHRVIRSTSRLTAHQNIAFAHEPLQRHQMNFIPDNEPTITKVANELRRYDAACADLLSLLRNQQRTRQEDHLCVNGYAELKTQLKRDAAHGTIGGIKRSISDAECLYFKYAVRHAAQALRPPINLSSVGSTWAIAVSSAQSEIQYKLRELEKTHPNA